MLIIGSHVSFNSKTQLLGSVESALSYGSNTFMFYTGAPQNTRRGKLDDNITKEANKLMKDNNINKDHLIVHAPYIVNLANNKDPDKYQFSIDFLRSEVDRCIQLGVKNLVMHPGNAVGIPLDIAMDNIINGINEILKEDDDIHLLLETMAGKGTEIGRNIEELKTLINGVNFKDKIGVCLDTCHLSDSGVNINEFDQYLELFEKEIGLDYIKCVHVNDSKNEIGSRKDRHDNIGFGKIGFDPLINVIYNEKLKNIPKILETPFVEGNAPYKHEIEMIKEKKFNENLQKEVENL